MAITFVQQQKRQQYLLFILVGVVLFALFILWRGFFAAPAAVPVPAPKAETYRKIEINFNIFQHAFFTSIEEFPRIPSFEAVEGIQLGRENPFVPPGAPPPPTEELETEELETEELETEELETEELETEEE